MEENITEVEEEKTQGFLGGWAIKAYVHYWELL